MIPHDYHIHTRFSVDCAVDMQDLCERAVALGIPEIGFTDHYDLNPREQARDSLDLDGWIAELESCRRRFAGRLEIRAGIEIGEPHLYPGEVRLMMGRYAFDYSLGSLHWVGDAHVFEHGSYTRSESDAYSDYFEELELMTRTGEFSVLAHLDVPARTALPIYGGYDPRPFEGVIRPVLRNCIDRGIAVEINSGTLRKRAGILTPGPVILGWYAEMGGKQLTLGSDAHALDQLGAGLDTALEAARAAGFRQLTCFEGRTPRPIPIPRSSD